ncbi:MAG: tetratricopeptide repeat protein [Methylophilaceae bacterium]
MSLLIKALDKAQAEKARAENEGAKEALGQQEKEASKNQEDTSPVAELTMADANTELSLSPPEVPLKENAGVEANLIPTSIVGSAAANLQMLQVQKENAPNTTENVSNQPFSSATHHLAKKPEAVRQTQAANVFSAKQVETSHQNTKLALIAGAGLIAMLAMGSYYYQFVDSSPDVVIPQRPMVTQPTTSEALPPASQEVVGERTGLMKEGFADAETPAPDTTQAFEAKEPNQFAQKQQTDSNTQPQQNDAENTLDAGEAMVKLNKKGAQSNFVKLDKAIASASASIQVTQIRQQPAVNPILMRAYEAYNVGNDNEAQKLYKQVLQRDSTSVDAMLGLGAIAARQGRDADANGWYRKVLEIEPRNSTAQSAMLDTRQQDDPLANESRIKSMLAKAPNDANLYAALGNLYVEQNQWPAAQQAYFDAYRLNASADNALNLGVSLDQLSKPKLALPYYQQALDLAQQSDTSSIDKTAIEARIASIQSN